MAAPLKLLYPFLLLLFLFAILLFLLLGRLDFYFLDIAEELPDRIVRHVKSFILVILIYRVVHLCLRIYLVKFIRIQRDHHIFNYELK